MRFYIANFGCQMNEHDVDKMEYLLAGAGYERIGQLKEADIVIVNTCCVREKAEQKFYSLMGRLSAMRKKKGTLLGVTGCIAQMEKERLKERLPYIDFALGPSAVHRIAEAVGEAAKRRATLDFSENGCNASLLVRPGKIHGTVKARVTIMKGCDNFCSYCVVPYVRGREESRKSRDVLEEIEDLARIGVKEVTLLGQNVNSYNRGRDDLSFPQLLRAIDRIGGIERIRFVTSHPKDLSEDLITCFGDLEKLCESIHLPFQAGSDSVLARMNRGYTAAQYRAKVEALRERCPEIALSADCIVGFPGESPKDFERTVELVRDVRFDGLFSFAYSPRPFTAASLFPDVLPREEALERLAFLQGIQRQITLEKNRADEGKRVEVLVEGRSKHSPDDLMGRTRTNKIVNFRGPGTLLGACLEVRVVKGYANSLRGELGDEKGVRGG